MKINGQTTLCFLVKDGKVCLGMKKRGFGTGNWNGIGGKQQEGETIMKTFLRETEEELTIKPIDFEKLGELKFYYLANEKWNQRVHVYVIYKWEGEPKESEEVKPDWWPIDNLPFHSMWPDDPHWLPPVLAGQYTKAKFIFGEDNKIKSFKVNVTEN
jgi:8-oxo-dGTP pyrophosphatase MutT (NUDIX family)